MKIGAKEMKKAYKDVKLDQIDVWMFFSTFTAFMLLYKNIYKCVLICVTACQLSGFTGPAGRHDG